MWWVVFETTILRWVVAGSDHDAVGLVSVAAVVISEDRVGNRGGRGEPIAGILEGAHTISRKNFERWIAPDLERIGATADAALTKAGLEAKDIDRVFLTGGTSFVPAVRRLFEDRFPAEKIDSGEQLLSIAKGLALIAGSDDMEAWAA